MRYLIPLVMLAACVGGDKPKPAKRPNMAIEAVRLFIPKADCTPVQTGLVESPVTDTAYCVEGNSLIWCEAGPTYPAVCKPVFQKKATPESPVVEQPKVGAK